MRILTESAQHFGLAAAERYHRLMLAAFSRLAEFAVSPVVDEIPGMPGVYVYPLALARRLVPTEIRVRDPRHLIIYRLASDGFIEILGLVHDRMLLGPEADRLRRSAED